MTPNKPDSDRTAGSNVSAAVFIVITTAVVLAIAWWLWTSGGDRGQAVAFTLAGAAATHLMRESRELLAHWSGSGKGVGERPSID